MRGFRGAREYHNGIVRVTAASPDDHLVVPTLRCLTMDDNAPIQAMCWRPGSRPPRIRGSRAVWVVPSLKLLPQKKLRTWSHQPRPNFGNRMPVELRSNGTTRVLTRHAEKEHSERDHHDWHIPLGLPLLPVWYLRLAKWNGANLNDQT